MAILKNHFTLLAALMSTTFTLTSAYYDDDSLMYSSLYAREADYDDYNLPGGLGQRGIDWDEQDDLIVRDYIEGLYVRTPENDPPAGNQQSQTIGHQHAGQGGNTNTGAYMHPPILPPNPPATINAQAQAQGNAPAAAQANTAGAGAGATHGHPNIPRLNLAGVDRTRTESIGSAITLGNGDAQNPVTRPKQPGKLSQAKQKIASKFKSASRNRYETLHPNGPLDYAGMSKQEAKDYRKDYMLHHGGTSPRARDYEAFRNNEAAEWNLRNAERVQRAEGKKALYDKKHMKATFRSGAAGTAVNAASAAGVIVGALKPRSADDYLLMVEDFLLARDADADANMVDEEIWGGY